MSDSMNEWMVDKEELTIYFGVAYTFHIATDFICQLLYDNLFDFTIVYYTERNLILLFYTVQ